MNYGFPWNWPAQRMDFWAYPFVLPFIPFILPLVLLEVILKAFALWRAAKNNQKYWFIALIFINTAGILPILYLLFFQNHKPSNHKS